jgi:valyl-tRNA synthetase
MLASYSDVELTNISLQGMKRFHARVAVVKALQDAGLYIETKDNPMQIPICNKSGDVIEPILKPQWWVNCQPLAEEAIKVRQASSHELVTLNQPDLSALELVNLTFSLSNPKTNGTGGWKGSKTGVSLVSYGGVIAVLHTLSG